MTRLLAIEWNDTEARLAVARARGRQIVLEQAFTVPLELADVEAASRRIDIGRQIAAALTSRKLGRIPCLVVVGRSAVDGARLLPLESGPLGDGSWGWEQAGSPRRNRPWARVRVRRNAGSGSS